MNSLTNLIYEVCHVIAPELSPLCDRRRVYTFGKFCLYVDAGLFLEVSTTRVTIAIIGTGIFLNLILCITLLVLYHVLILIPQSFSEHRIGITYIVELHIVYIWDIA